MSDSLQTLRAKQSELMQKIAEKVLQAHEMAYLGTKTRDFSLLDGVPGQLEGLNDLILILDNTIAANITNFKPDSVELRESVAYLKITNEFERIGNSARKFNRDIKKFLQDSFKESNTYNYTVDLYAATVETIRQSVKACSIQSKDLDYDRCLNQAIAEESKTDDLFSMIHKEIIFTEYQDEIFLRYTIELFNSIRRLERAADHAVNVIRLMIYAKQGGMIGEY